MQFYSGYNPSNVSASGKCFYFNSLNISGSITNSSKFFISNSIYCIGDYVNVTTGPTYFACRKESACGKFVTLYVHNVT
jgi:hypothetical protein